MTTPSRSSASARTARLVLHTTPEQKRLLRRAAEVAKKSLTDFILDSAYLAAQETLLDQRLFMVTGDQFMAFLDILDQPGEPNPRLQELLSSKAPWDEL